MKFCSNCSHPLVERIPEGDHRNRFVCLHCDTIHYQNPKIVAGAIVEWQDKILLCKRGIEPRYGLWTLPAGFMENHETTEQAAIRETLEETCAKISIHGLYSLYSIPHISQVYMFFRAALAEPVFSRTNESLEVELVDEASIPWDELAFPVVRATLEHYFADRKNNSFPLRTGFIESHQKDMIK